MAIKIPSLLTSEIRHAIEQLQDRIAQVDLRRWVNESPRLIVGLAVVSALLLGMMAVRAFRSTSTQRLEQGKTAWFYDANTGKLFVAGRKKIGPIAAPSGPAPGGEPAGFRAHAYSYTLEANESDLFVGFLERPDPAPGARRPTSDMSDMDKWAQGRLIKRVKDQQWVQATSREGQAILQELARPNEKGQTPIYQIPR